MNENFKVLMTFKKDVNDFKDDLLNKDFEIELTTRSSVTSYTPKRFIRKISFRVTSIKLDVDETYIVTGEFNGEHAGILRKNLLGNITRTIINYLED